MAEHTLTDPYNLDRELILVSPRVLKLDNFLLDFPSIVGRGSWDTLDLNLYSIWNNMLRRCYLLSNKRFAAYGGMGVKVCNRWHNFETFIQDVKNLPNFKYKNLDLENFHLDKDYFGSDTYSPETCVWLHKDENALYLKSTKPLNIDFKIGKSKIFLSMQACSRFLHLPLNTVYLALRDKEGEITPRRSHWLLEKGATVSFLPDQEDGKLLRLKL